MTRRGAIYSALIVLADFIALGLDSLILSRNMLRYLTLFTLGQAGLLFFLGGAMDIAGSVSFTRAIDRVTKSEHQWSIQSHKRTQSRAAPFIMTGVFLSVVSFLLAYPLN